MNRPRHQLIEALAADLRPVRSSGRTSGRALAWLAATFAFAAIVLLVDAPFRAGSLHQLVDAPRFGLESLLGVAAIVALARAGFGLAVPGPQRPLARAAVPLLLLGSWIACYVYGLFDPALPFSMNGKRALCVFEAALLGLPPLALGLACARRLWALHGAWSGALLGLAAGAVPALLMQLACMYVPSHILLFHLLPGLTTGIVGALLGALLLRPR